MPCETSKSVLWAALSAVQDQLEGRRQTERVSHCLNFASGFISDDSVSSAGMVLRALDTMEAWVKSCPRQGLKGLAAEKPLQPVPRWIDALLLLVNSCTTIIWKDPEPDAPADKAEVAEPQVMPCSSFGSGPETTLKSRVLTVTELSWAGHDAYSKTIQVRDCSSHVHHPLLARGSLWPCS